MQTDKRKYQRVVAYIKNEVAKRRLKPGDRLPTERDLSVKLHLGQRTKSSPHILMSTKVYNFSFPSLSRDTCKYPGLLAVYQRQLGITSFPFHSLVTGVENPSAPSYFEESYLFTLFWKNIYVTPFSLIPDLVLSHL